MKIIKTQYFTYKFLSKSMNLLTCRVIFLSQTWKSMVQLKTLNYPSSQTHERSFLYLIVKYGAVPGFDPATTSHAHVYQLVEREERWDWLTNAPTPPTHPPGPWSAPRQAAGLLLRAILGDLQRQEDGFSTGGAHPCTYWKGSKLVVIIYSCTCNQIRSKYKQPGFRCSVSNSIKGREGVKNNLTFFSCRDK
jgi:hypothetical protein